MSYWETAISQTTAHNLCLIFRQIRENNSQFEGNKTVAKKIQTKSQTLISKNLIKG